MTAPRCGVCRIRPADEGRDMCLICEEETADNPIASRVVRFIEGISDQTFFIAFFLVMVLLFTLPFFTKPLGQ